MNENQKRKEDERDWYWLMMNEKKQKEGKKLLA
jgi:hypothetical protein